ncbi:MAG: tetratricopeptide repeat protein [Kofleriaceae bacterium]|nr:tetratricopeptide repeat protein [Kofleriaceae bacterium]
MRGHAPPIGSVDLLARAILEEFPELDPGRVRAALERGVARAAAATLDTEGYRVVDLHLARVEATEESGERARLLRDLSETLEERGDADRALVVRLAAFSEVATAADVDPLLRLARITEREAELPLDTMNALIDLQDDAAARRLIDIATAWQKVGRPYYAADCLERVLVIDPANAHAHDSLELFYRSTSEWPVLVDLLNRRTVHLDDDAQRAELFREIAHLYDRKLGDDASALEAYREADRLVPGHPDVLEGMARLAVTVGVPDEEALEALERLGTATTDPAERARINVRAAEMAKLFDWDRAQRLFEAARKDNPALPEAVDGFALLLRDRGQFAEAIELLLGAAHRTTDPTLRSRWLTDAADYCVAQGETMRAEALYREARVADPENDKAGIALVELCLDTGALVDLAPILDELCRTTDDPARLRHYLLQRSKVAAQLGDKTGARRALVRAVELDPADTGPRAELADMLYDAQQWVKARPMLESLLEDEDLLSTERRVELHFRIAHCAAQLGDKDSATKHLGITLALQPDHRPALHLGTELDHADPFAYAAGQLALANLAPPEEKATRFAALGDRYAELGDNATAREMYREALSHRPGDHLLLTKFLGLVTEDGDWGYSLDVVQRLVDTESDPKVRARYRHLAGMIARDELDDHERAVELLAAAVADDPQSFLAADELEALLASSSNVDALIRFYYQRLEHVRTEEGRAGERLRLWDHLGELCLQRGRTDDAITAFEVALTLAPDDLVRRQRMADLYFGSPAHDAAAIVQHQAILRGDKRRKSSYTALRSLYLRTQQAEKARACDDAFEVLRALLADEPIEALFRSPDRAKGKPADARVKTPLINEDFLALATLDVDAGHHTQLAALFALVAPPFGVERARMRPPPPVPSREYAPTPGLDAVVNMVVTALGVKRPAVYLEVDQRFAAKMQMRTRDGVLAPVLVIGKAALDGSVDDRELAFVLARQLADLRNERIARLLCPRAGELAQIVELALAPHTDAGSHAARWLSSALHPVELDQVLAIGTRLRERGISPMTTALTWLSASDRAADRIGLVVTADLATCCRILERELPAASGSEADRLVDLVWASVSEEVLAVRRRVEGWGATEPARKKTSTINAVESR